VWVYVVTRVVFGSYHEMCAGRGRPTQMTKNIRFFVKRYEVYITPPPIVETKKSEMGFWAFVSPPYPP
jgi:hypothetical protein